MSTEDILAELRDSYLNGFPNQTGNIESLILDMEKGTDIQDSFEALYRQVHSIKGSAGTFGFSIISSICHQMEDYLTDHVNQQSPANSTDINNLFAYLDLLVETWEGLAQETTNIGEIEKKLELISKKSQPDIKKCICVGISDKLYQQIIQQVAKSHNIQCTFVSNGMMAMERLLHEHFDVLISSRENSDINGCALIATLRLNRRKNENIQSILITSNPDLRIPSELHPNSIVKKDKEFPLRLAETISEIVAQ